MTGRRTDDVPTAPGEFCIRDADYGEGRRGPYLLFTCPRGQGVCSVPLRPSPPLPNGALWDWNGNRDRPTVTPSINCVGGCGWHGFMLAGELRGA